MCVYSRVLRISLCRRAERQPGGGHHPVCPIRENDSERSKKIPELIDLSVLSDCLSNWDDFGHSDLCHPEICGTVRGFEHAASSHNACVDCDLDDNPRQFDS